MNKRKKFKRSVLYPIVYGGATGILSGIVIALFLVCARIISSFVSGLYEGRDGALAVICIIILVLLCCMLVAVVQTLCPAAKGSGIPLAEGAARGMLRVKWLSALAGLITGSLLSFAAGMPLGSEGPSIGMGGLIGDGIGATTKKSTEMRRHLITGGACAGLAAAFNAPLTGLCFAFEETHRRLSPYIIATALSAVITSVATTQAIFFGLGHVPYLAGIGIGAGNAALAALGQTSFASGADMFAVSGIAAICGVVCAGLGVGFDRATAALSKLFGRINNAVLRLLPAFALSCGAALALYLAAGPGESAIEEAAGSALWLVIALLALRFITTVTASGSGATGGLFLPIISIGGLLGVVAARISITCGLDTAYARNVTMICICAFFASTVRAPITAVVLAVELTASFVNLLPCVIAVAIATVLTDLTKTAPLYEQMLERLIDAAPLPRGTRSLVVRGLITDDSPIAAKRVRDIMWPYNSLVTELDRDGKALVPDGETILLPGDTLTVRAENVDSGIFYSHLGELLALDGPPPDPGADARNLTLTARNIK